MFVTWYLTKYQKLVNVFDKLINTLVSRIVFKE